MKILDFPQRSPEWYRTRETIFTASETGDFVAEEKKCRLLKAEIQELLTSSGISFTKSATNDELVSLLPDATPYLSWTQSTVSARQNIIAKKLAAPFYTDPRFAGLAGSAWLLQLREREEKALDYNPAVQRGIALEDLAREAYESRTGHKVTQVGVCIHDNGGFGCSPDGLISDANQQGGWRFGVEIKCPIPETHAKYLLAGTLPDEYRPQVHHSMAATGLDRWDFFSFCPGMPPHHVTVTRDDYTERFLAGLLSLAAEMEKTRERLAEMWAANGR